MFRREATARAQLQGDALTRAMVGIGMLLAAESQPDANLEDTIVAASEEGMERDDLLMGPSYRADMWAALGADPGLSAAELARRTYGSFATAWQVKRDAAVVAAGQALLRPELSARSGQ